jgi:cold shock CspA family protein
MYDEFDATSIEDLVTGALNASFGVSAYYAQVDGDAGFNTRRSGTVFLTSDDAGTVLRGLERGHLLQLPKRDGTFEQLPIFIPASFAVRKQTTAAERRRHRREDAQSLLFQGGGAAAHRSISQEHVAIGRLLTRQRGGAGGSAGPHGSGGGRGGARQEVDIHGAGRGGAGRGGTGFAMGTAKRWNDRGFCLIKPEDGSEDVFCHFSSITDGDQLSEGARVKFKKVYNERRGSYRAENVTGGIPRDSVRGRGRSGHTAGSSRGRGRGRGESHVFSG